MQISIENTYVFFLSIVPVFETFYFHSASLWDQISSMKSIKKHDSELPEVEMQIYHEL